MAIYHLYTTETSTNTTAIYHLYPLVKWNLTLKLSESFLNFDSTPCSGQPLFQFSVGNGLRACARAGLPPARANQKLKASWLCWWAELIAGSVGEPWWAMVSLAHSCSLPRSFHILSLKRFLHGGHLGSQEQARSASSKIISLHPSSIPSTNSKDPYEVTPALQPSSDFEKKASQHNTTLPRSRNVCSTLVQPHLPFNHRSSYWQDKHGKMEIRRGRMLNFRWFRSTLSCGQLQSVQTSSSEPLRSAKAINDSSSSTSVAAGNGEILRGASCIPGLPFIRYMYCVYLHICTCVYIYILYYIYIYLFICIHTYICICSVCVYVMICVWCIYIYIYICRSVRPTRGRKHMGSLPFRSHLWARNPCRSADMSQLLHDRRWKWFHTPTNPVLILSFSSL